METDISNDPRIKLGRAMLEELGRDRVIAAAGMMMQDQGLITPGQIKANDVADWIGTLDVEQLQQLRKIAKEQMFRRSDGTWTGFMPGPGGSWAPNWLIRAVARLFAG